MALFESSAGSIRGPGVFFIEVATPKVVEGIGNGRLGLVGQFDFGPVKVAYVPDDIGDLLNTFAPQGSARTSTGWLAITGRKAPFTIARVLGGAAGILPPTGLATANVSLTGSSKYKYVVVAKNATGATMASYFVTHTTGCADLSAGSSGITITWSAVTGATSYDVYRTYAGGATTNTTGKLGNTASATINDTGAALLGETAPTANTTGYAPAQCFIYDAAGTATNSTTATCIAILTARWSGTSPNSAMSATVADDSGADATKFNLSVVLTNSRTGTKTETYTSLKSTSTQVSPDVSVSYLLDRDTGHAWVGTPAARPLNGSYSFVGGSNGASITSTDYDDCLTQLDSENDVAVYCADDCGDSIRTAVNTALKTHVVTKTDRQAVLQCSQADSWATVKGSSGNGVGAHSDKRCIFTGWVYVLGIAGTDVVSPFGSFIGSAICGLEPQISHALYDSPALDFYVAVTGLVTTKFNPLDETVIGDATEAGICLPTRLEKGQYAALNDRTTDTAVGNRFSVTYRIRRFLAKSMKTSLQSVTNAPNTVARRRQTKMVLERFGRQQAAKERIQVSATGVPQFSVSISDNTTESIAAGYFNVGFTAQTPAPSEKIVIYMNVGPTVEIDPATLA